MITAPSTEMAAVLATARSVYGRRLVVIFQPHRFSRTAALGREFAECSKMQTCWSWPDIYPAESGRSPASVPI